MDFKTPAELYQPSFKAYPEKLQTYEYDKSDLKRKVSENGIINFKNREFKVGKAFIGEYVALKESQENNMYEIYFCNQLKRTISL